MGIKQLLNKDITQSELLNYFNATIQYDYLPDGINGCVFNYKGIFVILINNTLTYYMKRKTILHELAHIELCQLEQNDKDLFALKTKQYEDEADKYIKKIINELKENI
jgi:Zn-dependent peptidase ImmA (M78 family)